MRRRPLHGSRLFGTAMKKDKPFLLITAGEPSGIGPEVTVKALQDLRVRAACHAVLVGEPISLIEAGYTPQLGALLPIQSPRRRPAARKPSAWGGEISFTALETACELAAQTHTPLVTAPISKQSWAKAGIAFTGHTEFLRKYYGKEALMMFTDGALRCALVSEHFAIKDLPRMITKERIVHTGKAFAQALKKLGIAKPHIAVSALNPHGGDNGRFGEEEKRIISPAVRTLQACRINAQGPYPADSLWQAHCRGRFDGILCMYHDQALLGLKLGALKPVVHITAGLEFLRVSPTHGTAFDIAGKDQADPSSMTEAILFAAQRCPKNRLL